MKSIITFCLIICGVASTLLGQVVTLGLDNGAVGSLRQQIELAAPGSTISFADSVITVRLNSEIIINKNITITGLAGLPVTIDAGSNSRIFNVTDGEVILNNLSLTNGLAVDGGAIFNSAQLTLNDCVIIGCVANGMPGSGGAIFNDTGAVLEVNNSTMSDNTAIRAGGAIEDNSGAGLGIILNNVLFTNNSTGSAPGNGGALHITGAGDATVTGCTLTGNSAASEGGGLWNGIGTMTVSGSILNSNTCIGNGANQGGAGLFNAGGTLIVENCTINNNVTTGVSTSGGGILNDLGVLSVSDTEISGNASVRAGGGIEDNSAAGNTLILTNVILNNNSTAAMPGNGGGLHITGPGNSMVDSCTVIGNTASAEGGGLWNGTGTMRVSGTVFNSNMVEGNGADQGGAGLFNAGGILIVDGCMIINNTTTGTSTSGGGILNDLGTLTVTNTSLSGNTAIRAGGGIEDNSAAGNILTMDNVTLLSNTTGSSPGNGGGLHITGPGNSMISNSIVSTNTAEAEGGGLWNGSGVMTISSTDINNNIAKGSASDNGGGGVFNNGGTLNINGNTTITSNSSSGAAGSGGGLLSTAGEVTIENTTFTSNSANRAGGAIEIIDGNLTFTSSIMADNDVNGTAGTPAPGNGGGFHVTGITGSSIVFIDASFIGNKAAREGGALWNQSGASMLLDGCSVDGNTSFGTAVTNGGAGVFNNSGIVEIRNSTISNNMDMGAAAAGAGVHNKADGNVTILTSTLSNNTSSTGGGIYTNGSGLVINAATIAFNSATTSGGGIQSMTGANIKNTIVANNNGATGSDIAGTNFVSLGYNLIGSDDSNAFTTNTGDIVGVDPMLTATLAVIAGNTATHSLQIGSPAYNTGDQTDNFSDQNGQPVFDGRRDIGAHESQNILSSIDKPAFTESNIDVFPNPTTSKFNIEIPAAFGKDITIRIYSASTGVLLQEIAAQPDMISIDLSNYPSGIYLMNLQSDKFSNSQLISKE